MNQPPTESTFRILVIDDNPAIHEDFRKILGGSASSSSKLDAVEAALFGPTAAVAGRLEFRIDSAFQGREALV